MSFGTKMLLSISVHPLVNSSIGHINSSHLFPICLHPLCIEKGCECGLVLRGWWPRWAFWGLQHNQWDQISLHSTGSGNDYLELTQIKNLFLLSQQDQSKTAAPLWLVSEDVKITPVPLTTSFSQRNQLWNLPCVKNLKQNLSISISCFMRDTNYKYVPWYWKRRSSSHH